MHISSFRWFYRQLFRVEAFQAFISLVAMALRYELYYPCAGRVLPEIQPKLTKQKAIFKAALRRSTTKNQTAGTFETFICQTGDTNTTLADPASFLFWPSACTSGC
jgi:hypothetical protein